MGIKIYKNEYPKPELAKEMKTQKNPNEKGFSKLLRIFAMT